MANAVTHTDAVRNGIANYVVDLIDAGTDGKLVFRITGSTAASPATEVATLTFSATAFGAATGGVATTNAITSDTSATGGTAAFATLEDSAATVCAHCTVGTSGADINMSSVVIGAGDTVSVSALTYTAPA
jgi:hypothetical protein